MTLFLRSICGNLTLKPPVKLLLTKRNIAQSLVGPKKILHKAKNLRKKRSELLGAECAPNWELLGTQMNRFFLPNNIGPAWHNARGLRQVDGGLDWLLDFSKNGSGTGILKVSVTNCPLLVEESLPQLFPTREATGKICLMALQCRLRSDEDMERVTQLFVLAGCKITEILRMHNYWSDFINPLSGTPFHTIPDPELYENEVQFWGTNLQLNERNRCLEISTVDTRETFSGIIYSNAPPDRHSLKMLLTDQL